METDEVTVERSTRVKEAWVDSLFIGMIGTGFALECESRFVSWGFNLVMALAVALVLYNAYSIDKPVESSLAARDTLTGH